jgi:hypothetical protein
MISLESITSSSVWNPQKIIAYGVQGLGKTTFGCTFEKPILLRTEDGAAAMDVPTFPMARSYNDIVEMIQALHGDHPFKTVVLDSLDWLEPLVWAQTCARLGITSIEGVGYGKGYAEADSEWATLMGGFDSLRYNRGMTIVCIAHSEIKTFTPPDSPPYDRYQIKLHKRAWAKWQEWSDMTLFLNFEKRIVKNKDQVRAEGSGQRVIYTEERPSMVAKNRWNLPFQIDIGNDRTWNAFHAALADATNGKYINPNGEKA